MKKIKKILVVGLGKVGSLVAILLKESGFEVKGMDLKHHPDADNDINIVLGDVTDSKNLKDAMTGCDAVISCLPYNLNLKIAQIACENKLHYFDLTEDIPTTDAIRAMAKGLSTVMVPQCGLAPGFIGIVGANLARNFNKVRSIELKVGALPQHPSGLLGYAFNWSVDGVVNEYLNDCEVIQDGYRKMIPALQEEETIIINGKVLEAFSTSGGLGTMCETYENDLQNLNYKTMRYPGHCKQMKFFFHELLMKHDRKNAANILLNACPPTRDDVVYIHAAVVGEKEKYGLTRDEFVRAYYPRKIANKTWRAISWTTAASAVAIIEMVNNGTLPGGGFIKQEDVSFDKFLQTKTGRFYNTELSSAVNNNLELEDKILKLINCA